MTGKADKSVTNIQKIIKVQKNSRKHEAHNYCTMCLFVCACARVCSVCVWCEELALHIARPRWHESVPAEQARFSLPKFSFTAWLACSVCSQERGFLLLRCLYRRKSKVEFSSGNTNTTVALAATSTSWPAHTSPSVFVMELPQQSHQKHVAHVVTVNPEWEQTCLLLPFCTFLSRDCEEDRVFKKNLSL